MTYEEALEYIHGLYWRGKKSGLEKTRELLDLCGHPEQELRCIHIAGTNGKGSTAAMLAAVCQAAGYRVGLYTSPYIVRYNERIQVNREEIGDAALAGLTTQLAAVAEQMEVPPSEFEFGTVLAFLYFKEQKCDLVLLETGLGGTFDSTNILENPLLCIITALGFDHMAQLGSTMAEIAGAKAGIIKPGVPVVFYGENEEGEAVIRERCRRLHAELILPDFGTLFSKQIGELRMAVKTTETTDRFRTAGRGCQLFSYKAWENVELSLPGLYQQKNAAVVLEAVGVLQRKGLLISEEQVRKGLSNVFWQARLEVLRESPLLLADGSHNPQGMRATIESLQQYFPDRKLNFLFGAMADKELEPMIALMLPLAERIYVTAPSLPRAMKAEALLALCEKCRAGKKQPVLVCCPTVKEALFRANKEDPEEVNILIGSLYLVGEAKKLLLQGEVIAPPPA